MAARKRKAPPPPPPSGWKDFFGAIWFVFVKLPFTACFFALFIPLVVLLWMMGVGVGGVIGAVKQSGKEDG